MASQLAFPGLADQILPKAAMRLGFHERKASVLIDLAGGNQNALRPQRDSAIAAGAREGDAFGDQALPEALAARARLDQQQAEVCDLVVAPDPEHRADRPSVDIGDPAAFARGVEGGDEFRRDLRDQSLERGIEAIFTGVARTMA